MVHRIWEIIIHNAALKTLNLSNFDFGTLYIGVRRFRIFGGGGGVGVGARFKILGGQGLEYWGARFRILGGQGGPNSSRHITS